MTQESKRILITGAGKRLGAGMASYLHKQGYTIAVHYNQSKQEAKNLCAALNAQRPQSAQAFSADLRNIHSCKDLVEKVAEAFNGFDALINSASTYYPTALIGATELDWDDLFGTNCKAPFFLTQAAAPFLKTNKGSVLNIADIQAYRPLKHYSLYCAAKAGLISLTQSLAIELAPEIRVNAIAPGLILPQETDNIAIQEQEKQISQQRLVNRAITAEDIAKAADYLLFNAAQITGQVLKVDGGQQIGF